MSLDSVMPAEAVAPDLLGVGAERDSEVDRVADPSADRVRDAVISLELRVTVMACVDVGWVPEIDSERLVEGVRL